MNDITLAVALFLLCNLVVALLAAARGPTAADRMLIGLSEIYAITPCRICDVRREPAR